MNTVELKFAIRFIQISDLEWHFREIDKIFSIIASRIFFSSRTKNLPAIIFNVYMMNDYFQKKYFFC